MDFSSLVQRSVVSCCVTVWYWASWYSYGSPCGHFILFNLVALSRMGWAPLLPTSRQRNCLQSGTRLFLRSPWLAHSQKAHLGSRSCGKHIHLVGGGHVPGQLSNEMGVLVSLVDRQLSPPLSGLEGSELRPPALFSKYHLTLQWKPRMWFI